jgi:hypothetical protein
MPSEEHVRAQARKVLEAGTIPRRDPDRTWGGVGANMPCAICGQRIPRDAIECEIEFGHDGATPGLDRFSMHLRCFAAWEMERTKP